jgi:putative ABC transport system permease protein
VPITPGYLGTIGTRLIRGRNVTEQDLKDKPFVALVNEAFVKQYLPDQDPIGQQIKESGNVTREIIGVTATVMNGDFEERAEAHIYTPYAQDSWRTIYLVIRGNADPAPLTAGVRNVASTFDKTLPVFNVKPMQQVIDERMSPKRLATGMMLAFALVALALAAVGIYAVMSYSVTQRINEIGIRIALGAQSRDIFKLIVGQGLLLTVLGLACGLGGAFGVTRAMAGLLYGVTTTDVFTYVGISLLLALIALLACYVPARRATKVDPMVALRYE